jgi:hypothetical protein
MGYRELLKKYVRFLEVNVGDNWIESIPDSPEPILTDRDMGELRTIAAEIYRESWSDPGTARVQNWNYRFRILLNRYGVSVRRAAEIAGVDEATVRRWRTHPRSRRYAPMTAEDFTRFETALEAWLESDEGERARGPGRGV